jgi:MFS family permease
MTRTAARVESSSATLTRPQFNAWLSAFVGWVFDYYEVFLLTFLAVPISREFGLNPGETAYIFSIQLLFLAVGGVFFGYLADRFGRQRVLMWTIVIYSIFTFARALTTNYQMLLVLTALAALGIGGEYGVGQTLVSEVMPRERRGWWSGLLYGGIYFGIALGALVGGNLAPAIGWRWTFALSGIPILVAIFVRFSTPESELWASKRGAAQTNWSLIFNRTFLLPFGLCLVAGVLQFFAYYGITTFLPTFLVQQGFSIGTAAWWLFFTAVAGLVGSIAGAYTNDRWGRRITLMYLAGSAAVGGLILFLSWQYLLTSPLILIPFFILYFGSNGATVFGALFSEQFPTETRSTGVSAALQIARGLAFLPPIIAAAIFPVYGYAPIVLAGAALFGLLAVWSFVFKETRGKDLHEVDTEVRAVTSMPMSAVGGAHGKQPV